MINPKILVTGATGRTGKAVVTQLLAKGWPVRAAVRVRDARSNLLQRQGAEVVTADIFDPGQLTDAMRGLQRAYYCPPYHPFVIQSALAFAVAARETGLEQIVGLSQWLAGPNHPALMSRQHWLIDQMFMALPSTAYTTIMPGFFADSPYLEMMPFVGHLGVLPLPIPQGFDPVTYDRAQEQPVPRAPRLALDDTAWTASHSSEISEVLRGMLKVALE
jgi:NAD(P)H dehydrogenase (quinone)